MIFFNDDVNVSFDDVVIEMINWAGDYENPTAIIPLSDLEELNDRLAISYDEYEVLHTMHYIGMCLYWCEWDMAKLVTNAMNKDLSDGVQMFRERVFKICDGVIPDEEEPRWSIRFGGPSIGDIFETLTETQKTVVYALIGRAIEEADSNEYQQTCLKTESGMSKRYPRIFNGLMGLNGEAGECIDILKKHAFQGHDLDKEKLAEELGDVAWYLAVSADAIGYKLSDIFMLNTAKLQKRYPDGFEAERSINRDE